MKKTITLKNALIITAILILGLVFGQIKVLAYDGIKLATGVIDPDDFNPGNFQDAFQDAKDITDVGGTIITVIRVIGIAVTVICLIIIGIKYMTGTIQEKADYKKSMIPYLIGVFIFFTLSQILPVIIDLVSDLSK